MVLLVHDIRKPERLVGVDKRLIEVVKLAVTFLPFSVIVVEGLRSLEAQKKAVDAGNSRTMKSKHLTGKAVDLAPVVGERRILWDDKKKFIAIGDAMMKAARQLNAHIRWGADWSENGVIDELELPEYRKKYGHDPLVDYPHFEIME